MDTQVSLARRFVALIVLFLIFACVTSLLASLSGIIVAFNSSFGTLHVKSTYQIVASIFFLLSVMVTWRILVHWQKRITRGESLWFQYWNKVRIVFSIACLILFIVLIPVAKYELNVITQVQPSPIIYLFNLLTKLTGLVALPIVWFWWCNQHPQYNRPVSVATLVWIIISILPWSSCQLVHLGIYSDDIILASYDNTSRMIIWSEQLQEQMGIWVLSIGAREFEMTFAEWLSSVVITILFVAFSRFIYSKIGNHTKLKN